MPKEAFKTLVDIVKPVSIERYTTTKIYFNTAGQLSYAYVVVVHSVAICFQYHI